MKASVLVELFNRIAHGTVRHRAWLLDELEAFFEVEVPRADVAAALAGPESPPAAVLRELRKHPLGVELCAAELLEVAIAADPVEQEHHQLHLRLALRDALDSLKLKAARLITEPPCPK